MRILQVFNRYLERGGEEMSVERISNILSKRHDVFHCYFDSAMWAGKTSLIDSVKHASMMIHNPESVRRFRSHVIASQPDLVLLHNIFPVGSTGLLRAAVSLDLPLFQVIHNFRPFSVNGYLWAGDRLLPQGLRKNFLPEVLAGSWQDSRLKTAVYAGILKSMHLSGIFRKIDCWLAISQFMHDTFVAAGVDPEKVHVLRHSWDHRSDAPESDVGDSAPNLLFLGRLTESKGITTLMKAWELAADRVPNARLYIGGIGPLENHVREAAIRLPRCDYLGFVDGGRKSELLRGCTAMVIPSVWWEALGLVAYEAYDYEKPVLAADSGGLAETVVPNETGWVHRPGDALHLAEHMVEALTHPGEARRRGKEGRNWLIRNTKWEDWLDRFEEIAEITFAQRAKDVVRLRKLQRRQQAARSSGVRSGNVSPCGTTSLRIQAYLADQNSKLGRSLGILRMTEAVLAELTSRSDISLSGVSSRSSLQVPGTLDGANNLVLPWPTRARAMRVLTDHLHPMLGGWANKPDLCYFPKGFLPLTDGLCRPSVVTIHDTIIQYYRDHYPKWRRGMEYRYLSGLLKHTLRSADCILTVSESSKAQIIEFMRRHGLPMREVTVTYEPCIYESLPQPENPPKGDYVIHLASKEPHKRTAQLVRWWVERRETRDQIPETSEASPQTKETRIQSPDKNLPQPAEIPLFKDLNRRDGEVTRLGGNAGRGIDGKGSADPLGPLTVTCSDEPAYESGAGGKQRLSLHLIGTVPPEVRELAESSPDIVVRPFLDEPELQKAMTAARALIFPSEIEGFGLPAIEAYYLGTPVCFTRGTSVEEVLGVATGKGGFTLDDPASFFAALDEVLAMSPDEVRECGLKLRQAYAASAVAEKMVAAFRRTVSSATQGYAGRKR